MAFLMHLFVFMPASTVTNGLAVMWMWRWFVAPFGVPEVGFWHAIGISMLASFLAMRLVASDFDDDPPLSTRAYRVFVTLTAKWMCIGIAEIVAGLMP